MAIVCGEKASDDEAAENYEDEFVKLIALGDLTGDQRYNADETSIALLALQPQEN